MHDLLFYFLFLMHQIWKCSVYCLFLCLLVFYQFQTLDPRLRPIFAKSDPSPFPDCCLAAAFRFCLISLNPSRARLKYIQWLFLLGPIVLTLLTLMFIGSCFLLILSHFETKDLPFGRLTVLGVALFLKIMCLLTIFFILFFFFFLYQIFFPE